VSERGAAWRASRRRVAEMLRKELRQIFRDPQLYRILFVAPLVQLLVFGYAVSTDVRHTRTFVVDHDGGTASRELLAAFTANGAFDVVGRSQREDFWILGFGPRTVGDIPPAKRD